MNTVGSGADPRRRATARRTTEGLVMGEKLILSSIAALAATGAMLLASPPQASADSVQGCIEQPWLYGLRVVSRVICDSELHPDGSWERRRGFFAQSRLRTTCGSYSCDTYVIPELRVIDEYHVTESTVLPDEPGHIA